MSSIDGLDPLGAHTFGLGEVMNVALCDVRVKEIIVAPGIRYPPMRDSAPQRRFGFRALDSKGIEVSLGGLGWEL